MDELAHTQVCTATTTPLADELYARAQASGDDVLIAVVEAQLDYWRRLEHRVTASATLVQSGRFEVMS